MVESKLNFFLSKVPVDSDINLFYESVLEELLEVTKLKMKYCPICDEYFEMFLPFNGRKLACCPKCKSLERHRLVYYYFKNKTSIFSKYTKLLHFAPETIFFNIFSNSNNIDYLTADIVDSKYVMEKIDMCSIPYDDNTFDVIYASHVLEHIPDDRLAMSELYRVVKPSSEGGFVVLMVPINKNNKKTFEDPSHNTDELRLKYYNQIDHVRVYGLDFKDRLESVGFNVEIFEPKDIIDDKILLEQMHLFDEVFVCKK